MTIVIPARPRACDLRRFRLSRNADFSRASRNKYASRYAAGSAVVVLEPDVAAAFPNAKAVNDALRMLIHVAEKSVNRS